MKLAAIAGVAIMGIAMGLAGRWRSLSPARLGIAKALAPRGTATGSAAAPSWSPEACASVHAALMADVVRGRTRIAPPQVKPAEGHARRPVTDAGVQVEDLIYRTEAEEGQTWVPLRLMKRKGAAPTEQLPVVIFLHATGLSLQAEHSKQVLYAKAGYLSVAVDARYHGERCHPAPGQTARQVYQQALIRAAAMSTTSNTTWSLHSRRVGRSLVHRSWRDVPGHRPFLLDNIWDLTHLLDYLHTRPDVDTGHMGVTGTSLGGIHAWLLAVLDTRVTALAPVIGIQNWGWAVKHNQYHGRVESIPDVFAAAAEDLGKRKVDAEVVEAVWRKVMPGLLDHYDTPMSLPCLAPRPLLVVNGELDHRCPLKGVMEAWPLCRAAYIAEEVSRIGCSERDAEASVDMRLQLHVERGAGHEVRPAMDAAVARFFNTHLLHA